MIYVEAFSDKHQNHWKHSPKPSLFLAGGITNCRNWQAEAAKALEKTDLVVLNPRREHWPMDDPEASAAQIKWEFDHLEMAHTILFWFSPETFCPITLFEYGKWLVRPKTLFVGCDPEYKRLEDVKVQTKLERPLQQVHTSLDSVIEEVIHSIGGI